MSIAEVTVDVLFTPAERRASLLGDARRGLTATPKVLSPVWFYDERGSTLFDEITRLPEYYLTRSELRLLGAGAPAIAERCAADTLVELGSGTSAKTRLLLDAMVVAGTLRCYAPLDVSEETLRSAASDVAREYDGVAVHAVVGDFHQHLGALPAGDRRLVAFLGSTIGNLDPAERARFLFDLDCVLTHGDHLLLGVDLVKDADRLLAAYDDAAGVTAAFNRNALRVANAELAATFDPASFDHVAVWDAEQQWIEMHLRARAAHTVRVGALDLELGFDEGETIRTEISSKFTTDGFAAELEQAGFVVEETWSDGGDFLVVLARPYC